MLSTVWWLQLPLALRSLELSPVPAARLYGGSYYASSNPPLPITAKTRLPLKLLFHFCQVNSMQKYQEPTKMQSTLPGRKMSSFSRFRYYSQLFLKIAGCGLVFFGSFFATLRIIDTSDILTEARRGVWLNIQLDPKLCRANLVGVLQCGPSYRARYFPSTNSWKVSGPVDESAQVITESYRNAPNQTGSISIFGLLATFDQNGRLTVKDIENAGAVSFDQPLWQRAFFSEAN